MRVLMIGVRQEERLTTLLEMFGSRDEFPDILIRTGRSDLVSRRLRHHAETDCKRLEAALQSLQSSEDRYLKCKAAGTNRSDLDSATDRCTKDRNRLESIVQEFGRVQIVNHADAGWIPLPLESISMSIVGDRQTGKSPSQLVTEISQQDIFTIGIYARESDTSKSFADEVLSSGAAAAMSEDTLATMLESILTKRRNDSSSPVMEWLPHSLPLLLRERC